MPTALVLGSTGYANCSCAGQHWVCQLLLCWAALGMPTALVPGSTGYANCSCAGQHWVCQLLLCWAALGMPTVQSTSYQPLDTSE